MKRLLILTLTLLLVHTAAFAELSCAAPAPKPARKLDGTTLSIDLEDHIISRPARAAPAELPRTTPDFRASLPPARVRASWQRPTDLSDSLQTADLARLFKFGAGTLVYLFALVVILYVRSARAGTRVLLARVSSRRAGRLSTPAK